MKKIFYMLSIGLSLLAFNSCKDYLDKEVDTNLTEDKIFSDVHYAPGFLYNIYNDLLTGYNRYDGAMLACGCDEAKTHIPVRWCRPSITGLSTHPSIPMISGTRCIMVFVKPIFSWIN